MRVKQVFTFQAASASNTSPVVYLGQHDRGSNATFVWWLRTTVNPSTQDVDFRVDGRPDDSAQWYQISQVTGASGWFSAGGGIFTLAVSNLPIFPQLRCRSVAVVGSTNTLHVWIQE